MQTPGAHGHCASRRLAASQWPYHACHSLLGETITVLIHISLSDHQGRTINVESFFVLMYRIPGDSNRSHFYQAYDTTPTPNLDPNLHYSMADLKMASASLTQPPTNCPFHTLPTEILLEIISSVPFTPADFLSLRLTCRRFHDVLTHHEAPIAAATRRRTFDAKTTILFPGLHDDSLRNLGRLHARVQTLESVHEHWLKITQHSPQLEWLKGRFEGVHKAGLLLLYHLQDLRLQKSTNAEGSPICEHCQRAAFLRSLPATSLACLLFKLVSSVRILRVHGPEPIAEGWKKGNVGARSDVELVCEELILRNGPWFFLALLQPDVEPKETGRALG